jgi:hypothetical protein
MGRAAVCATDEVSAAWGLLAVLKMSHISIVWIDFNKSILVND